MYACGPPFRSLSSSELGFFSRLKLRALHRFTSTATAVEEITAIQEGKIGKGLKKFLSEEIVEKGKGKQTLFVADNKLGTSSLRTVFVPQRNDISYRSFNIQEAQDQRAVYVEPRDSWE